MISSPNIIIRREAPDPPDVVALIEALDAFHLAIYPAESNHFLDLDTLRGPDVHFAVARRDGVAVGCGAYWRQPERTGEIKRMFVVPTERGNRVGARLLTHLIEQARSDGLEILRLETGVHSAAALGLYRAAGFRDRGPFADYGPDPMSVFMELRL